MYKSTSYDIVREYVMDYMGTFKDISKQANEKIEAIRKKIWV